MKTLAITTAVAALFGTVALSSSQVDHRLTTGKLSASCTFDAPVEGEMVYDEASNRFVTITPSTMVVDHKHMSSMVIKTTGSIKANDFLGTIVGEITSIDWSNNATTLDGVPMTPEGDGRGARISFAKNVEKNMRLSIEPVSVTIDTSTFAPQSNAVYTVTWEATCFE